MSQAAAFCYVEGDGQISVHLELDGSTIVQVLDGAGEVSKSYEDQIDPRDAQRLITELFDVVPHMPTPPNGELWVSLYHNDERFNYQLSEYDMPKRALDVGRVMRMIAQDTMAGFQQRSSRKAGGPQRPKMTVFGFIKWTAFFILGFFVSLIIGVIGQFFGASIGPMAAGVGITFAVFCMEGSFYAIGVKFAEKYRSEFPAWPAAAVAAAVCWAIYFHFFGIGSFFTALFFIAAPGLAQWGASTSS